MKAKFIMPNGKLEKREIKVLNPDPFEDFASAIGIAGESIQGTYKAQKKLC